MTAMQQILLSLGKKRILTRTFFDGGYTETRSTTTSTTYTTRESVTTTEATGENFAVFWMAVGDYNNTSNDNRVRFLEGTTQRQLFNLEPKDTGDDYSFGGAYAYAGGTGRTFNIQHSAESSGDTSGIQAMSAVALRLEYGDVYNVSAGTSSTTNGSTYQTKCSVNPTRTGYYVLIGSASYNMNSISTTSGFEFRIGNDTQGDYFNIFSVYRKDSTNYVPANIVKVTYVNDSSDLLVMQYLSDGTNTVNIREASLIGLYIGETLNESAENFNKFYWNEGIGSYNVSDTYTEVLSVGLANPTGNYHLILASAQLGSDNTSFSAYAKLTQNTTTILHGVEYIIEPPGGLNTQGIPQDYSIYVARIVTFTAGVPATVEWSARTEDILSNTYLTFPSIVIIDLGVAP